MSFLFYIKNLTNNEIQRIFLSFENEFENTKKLGFGDSSVFELLGSLLLADYDFKLHDLIISLSRRVSNGDFSPIQFSDKLDEIIYTLPYLPYEEWSSIYRYLKETQLYWIKDHWQYAPNTNLSPLIQNILFENQTQPNITLIDSELKVVGVTFENRQQLIANIAVGEFLTLKRDYSNPYGSNATMVFTLNNRQLGYLSKEQSHIIAPFLDAGNTLYGIVTQIFKGTDSTNYGLRFKIFA